MKADKLRRHYKKHSSDFKDWEQKAHAEDYMLFPENIGENLSIDEVSLSQGELYTFVTNKKGKGKKGVHRSDFRKDMLVNESWKQLNDNMAELIKSPSGWGDKYI